MKEAGLSGDTEANVILTGAGTSEYIGNSVVGVLRKYLRREVFSVPTTDFVTHPESFLVPRHRYVIISFARSGNSPESIATYNLVKHLAPESRQIAVTCNKDGELAGKTAEDTKSLCILLPEETNDRSLAMTSSFSSMAFAAIGLCFLDKPGELKMIAKRLGDGAGRIMNDYADDLHDSVSRPISRVTYLGGGALNGTMQECRLKMLEMTDGKIAANNNTFLGLRHEPQVFINDECLTVAALSTDSYVRRYELDLLRELKEKAQGLETIVLCDKSTSEISNLSDRCVELYPEGDPVDDDLRIMTDVVAGQILALFKSLALGLKPDSPSTGGDHSPSG